MHDEFTHDGATFRLTLIPDEFAGTPWDNEDGHGPVSDWTRNAKGSGELILCEDRGQRRLYDFAEAVKIAKRDGWNAAPYPPAGAETPGQQAARAAMADYDRLRRYCAGDWYYVCVKVELLDDYGDAIDGYEESVWGVESDCDDHIKTVGQALAEEILSRHEIRAA
jgi:hypothetical protein